MNLNLNLSSFQHRVPSAINDLSSENAKLEYYPLFDWLRFVLASIVALVHAGVINWHYAGGLAVSVFFSLSGWLIGGILLKTRQNELPRFFFNRATRIWIPYFAAMIALYSLSALRDPLTIRWLEFLFYDLTFTHNWFSLLPDPLTALAEMPLRGTGNHFWSIAVEEQFYLAAPSLIIFLRFGKNPVFWGVVASVLCLIQPYFAAIALGVFAMTLRNRFGEWYFKPAAIAALIVLLLVSGVAMMTYWQVERMAPFFSIAIVLLAARPGQRNQIGMFFGAVSYPLYLNHWIGLFILHGLAKRLSFMPPLVEGLLGYAVGVVAGILAYLLIDKQIMERRNSWFSPQRGGILRLIAYGSVVTGFAVGIILASAR